MYSRAKAIISATSGFTAFKLLLATARQTRPWLDGFARKILELLSRDGELPYRYSCFGVSRKAFIRLAHLDSDLQSALELAVGDCYRLSQLPEPDFIVDGGGNTGMFTLAATARWPDAKIVVCEPLPGNLIALRKHVAINDLEARVHLLDSALGGEKGELDFYVREANRGSFDPDVPYISSIKVPIVTLREVLAGRTFERLLVKLDIEGAERDVLQTFFTSQPAGRIIFVMELHGLKVNRSFVEELAEKNDLNLEFFELGTDTGHCQLSSRNW